MKKLFLLFIAFTACTSTFSQNNPFKTIQFNVPIGGVIENANKLEVKGTLSSIKEVSIYQATLSDKPAKYLKKNEFILTITVTNNSKSDFIISDWSFRAVCPENNHGQQWNETSFVKLITPYIPKNTNIVLKPGEKKGFNTSVTDFYWCLPKHEKALTTPPCGFTAIITCSQVGISTNNAPTSGFFGNNCPTINYEETEPLDSELLALIEDFKKAQKSGNTVEANELKKNILEIAGHAYPNQIDKINALLIETPLKITSSTTNTSPSIKTSKIEMDRLGKNVQVIKIKNKTYYLTREIGYPIIGEYLYQSKKDPIVKLNADGTGLFQRHQMSRTPMVWGIECEIDGTPKKVKADWGYMFTIWYQIKEKHKGNGWESGEIDAWDAASFSVHEDTRSIYILGERIKNY